MRRGDGDLIIRIGFRCQYIICSVVVLEYCVCVFFFVSVY